MSDRIFLLDGHSLAHRAFYALPPLTNSKGEPTNSVFGFCRMLFKLLDEEDPEYIAVAFDLEEPTFRHDEYEDYKSTRKEMPEDLKPQIGKIKEVLAALNIPIFSVEGYEADDVIGTLAREAEKKDFMVKIVSGDRDTVQLVTDKVNVLYTKKGITDLQEYDPRQVEEEFELKPDQIPDMKGLMGDSSDDIPGVPGIGKVTARKLLQEYPDIEQVLDNIDQISGEKRRENLRKYSEQARMSKNLGQILVDIPLEIDLQDCRREEPNQKEVVELFEELEFGSLLERFKDQEEISAEEINITRINELKELQNLISIFEKTESLALMVGLEDQQEPVFSRAEYIMLADKKGSVYLLSADQDYLDEIAGLVKEQDLKLYLLNAKNTAIYFKRKNSELAKLEFDPLLAYYLLHPSENLPSREKLFEQRLNVALDDLNEKQKTAFMLINLFQISQEMQKELDEKELLELYHNIELPLINVLAEMEINGVRVDVDFLNKLSCKYEQKLATITEKVHELAGEEFNINSFQQLGEILFEKLGLPVIKETKTGYSTSIDVLEELEDKHEIVPLIIDYRQWSKFKSTYVDPLPEMVDPDTERIHTSFNQMVTATGRLSSTNPNLQNIPIRTEEGREIRKAFIPNNEDWVLLAADYSQVELRVLADISEDEALQEAFKKGHDIHNETASKVFGVEPGEVTSDMRREAKVINFGIAYGMSAYGLADDLDISNQEAEEYINRYFERFTGVKKYMDDIVDRAEKEGYVTTIFNRRRYIPEINSSNYHRRSFAKRTAINTPIQGSAADIMKIAMIDVYEAFKKTDLKARMLLQIHDELVLEVPEAELASAARLVKENMEAAVELSVPLVVDLETGTNLRDKHEYKI